MDTPRMGDDAGLAKTWTKAIQIECAKHNHQLPRCDQEDWFPDDWKSHGYVRTANPPPPP
jgi:hypothetical protein